MSATAQTLIPERIGERLDTARLIVRYRRTMLLVSVCAAVVSMAIAFLIPPTYTATARLLPPQQNQSLAAFFMGGGANSALVSAAQKDLGLKNPADIYIGLLNSRSIQDGLIQQFALAQAYGLQRPTDVRARLVANTRIQLTKEGLIAVSVEDRDANRAAALANGYGEQLRKITRRLALSEAAQRREFFDQQAQQARDDLANAESELRAVQEKTGILQVDAQARVLIETAASLRAQIAAGEVQLQAMRNFGTEQNPDVRQQEARLTGWRGELSRLESQKAGDAVFSKGRAPSEAQEYVRALRDVRYREAVLEMLLKQLEAARLDEAKEATVIQVVDTAVPPDERSAPKRAAIVLFTTLAAQLGAILVLRLRQRYQVDLDWLLRWQALRAEWRA